LAELDFVKTIKRENDEHYHIENSERDNLNHAILLFAILLLFANYIALE
jgi:hypothetical protein